jgi:hypothetical protein
MICSAPMIRRYILSISALVLLVVSLFYWESRETAYELAFDDSIARYPLAASIAARDPYLRGLFLQRTEAAFNETGWRGANGALKLALATEVEVYADDVHQNNVRRAELAVLLKLQDAPSACKAYLVAGTEQNEIVYAGQEFELLQLANRAAIENGFDRKMHGEIWTPPEYQQVLDVHGSLGRGPVAALTLEELSAETKYLDADPGVYCSAAIKRQRNLIALGDHEAAQASRVLLTMLTGIDISSVLSKLCRDKDNNLTCS